MTEVVTLEPDLNMIHVIQCVQADMNQFFSLEQYVAHQMAQAYCFNTI
jgi:hypothetical protein